jgi:hypothetical protein
MTMDHVEMLTPPLPPDFRVRPIDGGAPGRVVDVTEDGWLYWVSDDRACHFSRPSFVVPE